MIQALVTKYSGENSTILDLRLLITSSLWFARLLRIEELLDVNLKHIILRESHLEILMPKSILIPKTDQHRDGHVVYI